MLDAAENLPRAMFQLTHETVHLLSPRGAPNMATNLEEGVACVFAREMVAKYAPVTHANRHNFLGTLGTLD
jgi:hypothetical protein